MVGRHVRTTGRHPALTALVVALLVTAATALVIVWRWQVVHSHGSAAGAEPAGQSGPSTGSGGHCQAGVSVAVVADPSVASVIDSIAQTWMSDSPTVDNACVTVNVRGEGSAAMVGALTGSQIALPQLWIPDSSVWVNQVRSKTLGSDWPVTSMWLYPPIGTSPLVVAEPGANGSTARGGSWKSVLCGNRTPAIADPTSSADGLAAVLTAQDVLDGNASHPSQSLIDCMVRLARVNVSDTGAGIHEVRQDVSGAAPFVTSEQALVAAGSDQAGTVRTVYPSGPAAALDWPVVQFSPPGGDPAIRDAATAFVSYLAASSSQSEFRKAGLRDAAADPLPGKPRVQLLAPAKLSEQVNAGRVWTTASRTSRVLVAIDLSGSMSARFGARSKIQFAASALESAVEFFPDRSSLGLWGFSMNRSAGRDWTRIVGLGPLGDKVGGQTRRDALISAAHSLPRRTGGNTGLYATTYAAYNWLHQSYDPASVNYVVVLTDGINTDFRGITLPQLLARLRAGDQGSRHVRVITIAVGSQADVHVLREISAATGGRTYIATQPGDIQQALLDAVVGKG